MNYKELAKEILKLHRPDPDVILEVAIEQQATLKQFDESFNEGCEVLAKAHAQLIEAQESEAVWKTERDKADQRRLQAEAEVERLEKALTESQAQSHGLARRVVEVETMLEVVQRQLKNYTNAIETL